ncbi:hypothetical protein BAUCODRAFT_224889 [Baudoinia panamericana UAMH 10762]|uniref:Uncharacterized protein n=1 Tax=Baudoinia panamericana (strain UAMH 10762) TaxID=717646 RepID=M2MRU8_BAUPA|nr:uncharacterized protein BAUCODRAFT_224889 [Baudoinia panamericana UAMH 10762]EMC94218.1 hypothetical protein BAUCODRAFT_224889 [Baudoinia panamericana UAMH 10762]
MAAATDSGIRTPLTSSIARSPRSPDTASPIYPDRAIRPLPRSRLISRLSPEVASTIVYPAHPPPLASPLPPVTQQEVLRNGRYIPGDKDGHLQNGAISGPHVHDAPAYYHRHDLEVGHCTCGHDDGEIGDSGEEEIEFDHPDYRYATAPHTNGMGAAGRAPLDSVQRRLMEAARIGAGKVPSLPTASTASSADGYESFENTSNKKKRKIPLSTNSSMMHQSSLSAEMASMGISGQQDGVDDGAVAVQSQPYHPPAVSGSGTGVSGAGRGRYGRHENVRNGLRRPLGSGSGNLTNGHGSQRAGGVRAGLSDIKGVGGGGKTQFLFSFRAGTRACPLCWIHAPHLPATIISEKLVTDAYRLTHQARTVSKTAPLEALSAKRSKALQSKARLHHRAHTRTNRTISHSFSHRPLQTPHQTLHARRHSSHSTATPKVQRRWRSKSSCTVSSSEHHITRMARYQVRIRLFHQTQGARAGYRMVSMSQARMLS